MAEALRDTNYFGRVGHRLHTGPEATRRRMRRGSAHKEELSLGRSSPPSPLHTHIALQCDGMISYVAIRFPCT
jgi:hypothetical protein